MRIARLVIVGLVLPTWAVAASTTPSTRKEVQVSCDAGETIGRALSKLNKLAPSTLTITGTCRENVLISGFDDLRIVGSGATLVPVPSSTGSSWPGTAGVVYAIEVTTSRAVSIEGLTIKQPEDRTAMGFGACADCRLTNVTVDGGIAFYAYDWSLVALSRFKSTGTGGWASVGAWKASLFIEDSVFEDTSGGDWTATRWCGLCVGESASVNVLRSTFRHFGMGVGADTGSYVALMDTTVEDNWCFGVQANHGAHLSLQPGSRVVNNGSVGWGGGVNVDTGATLTVGMNPLTTGQISVTANTGGGIKLNHHALAQVGPAVVSSNNGPGLEVRNGSMAVMGDPNQPGGKAEISGNTLGGDLRCDSISHINNGALITGASEVHCVNLWTGDGPDIP